jgi:hypothetical protein
MTVNLRRFHVLFWVCLTLFPAWAAGNPSTALSPAKLAARDSHQYLSMRRAVKDYGKSGTETLQTAFRALQDLHRKGKDPLVELADLWTVCLQEGSSLFKTPQRLWGASSAEETLDMLGQTTVGPWQITVSNISQRLGPAYGIKQDWPASKVVDFCRKHHEVQAKMAADLIQNNYASYGGKRSPYGIQSYFWLEAYLNGEIGQGEWDSEVLVAQDPFTRKPADSPALRKNTGFYAKQILLGWRGQPHGILYWLWVANEKEGMKEALRVWKDQVPWKWDGAKNKPRPVPGVAAGKFEIKEADVKYCSCHPAFAKDLRKMVKSLSAGNE